MIYLETKIKIGEHELVALIYLIYNITSTLGAKQNSNWFMYNYSCKLHLITPRPKEGNVVINLVCLMYNITHS